MSLMAKVTSGKQPSPRVTLLYGTEGIGKSSFAAAAPAPIFIQTEDGLRDIDCHKFPVASSYDEVLATLGELYMEPHDYRSVAIDSLDWLEKLIWAKVAQANGKTNIEEIGYAKGYIYALDYWRQILEGCMALRKDRAMSVILVAHAEIKTFKNPEGEDYDRYVPKLHKFAAALIQEAADDVLFTTYKVFVKQVGEGFRKTHKAIGTDERIIHTVASPSFNAKNRLGLPKEIPLSWDVYASYFTVAPEVPAGGQSSDSKEN